MFELNVKSYIKRNPRLRQAKMGMLMSNGLEPQSLPPPVQALLLQLHVAEDFRAVRLVLEYSPRCVFLRKLRRRLGNQALHLPFLSWCPSGEVRPSSGRACLVSLCPK